MAAIPRARRRTLITLTAVACLSACSQVAPAAGNARQVAGRPPPRISHERLVTVAGPSGRPPILFVGASYTAGLGARLPGDGFAPLVARELGRPAYIDARPGSGFLNPAGARGGDFARRLRRLRLPRCPGIVFFQGGRNDTSYRTAALSRAADETFRLARSRFPGAEVVVLGPVPGDLPVSPALRAVDATLRAVSARDAVTYLDPIRAGWMTHRNLPRFTGAIRDHPNDAGYAYLAHLVVGSLSGARTGSGAAGTQGSRARRHAQVPPNSATPAEADTIDTGRALYERE
jgi:lysophospholipase L1-like esterase